MTTISRRKFNQLVRDFEYGIIDSYTIDESVIEWSESSQTCLEYVNGKVVATGSFERLLEWWLPEQEVA